MSVKKKRHVPLNSAAWRRLRGEVLASEPLCRMCWDDYRLRTRATEVDHIEDSREDYSDDNSRENLAPLCRECHSRKTRAQMQGKAVPVYGCDAQGIPLDPAHPWRIAKNNH